MTSSKLNFAIVSYLETLTSTLSDDDKESIEVAIQCLSGVLHVDPKDPDQKKSLSVPADLKNIFNLYLENLETQKKSEEGQKEKAEQLKNDGNKEMAAKNYERSIELYTEAINLAPGNAIYYSNRAAAYSCIRKFEEAVEDCKVAISNDPNYSKAYSRLGLALFQLKDFEKAVDAYKTALRLEPENAKVAADLKLAQEKADELAVGQKSTPPPRAAPGGMPNFGAGGMPDLGGLLNNPNLMSMAAQMMSNPNIQRMMQDPNFSRMAQNMMSGGAPDFSAMMQDPTMVNAAQQLAAENPDLVNQLQSSMRGDNPGGASGGGVEEIDE